MTAESLGASPGRRARLGPGAAASSPRPGVPAALPGRWREAPRAGGGGRGGDLGQPGTGRLQAAARGLIPVAATYFEQKGGKEYGCHADRGRLRRAMNYWSFYLLS